MTSDAIKATTVAIARFLVTTAAPTSEAIITHIRAVICLPLMSRRPDCWNDPLYTSSTASITLRMSIVRMQSDL